MVCPKMDRQLKKAFHNVMAIAIALYKKVDCFAIISS